MEKDILLKNLHRYCENFDLSWRFIEEIAEKLIEEYSKSKWKSCKIEISKDYQDEFSLEGDSIMVLSKTLADIGVVGYISIGYSSEGFVYIKTE